MRCAVLLASLVIYAITISITIYITVGHYEKRYQVSKQYPMRSRTCEEDEKCVGFRQNFNKLDLSTDTRLEEDQPVWYTGWDLISKLLGVHPHPVRISLLFKLITLALLRLVDGLVANRRRQNN